MSEYFEIRKASSNDPPNDSFARRYPEIIACGSLSNAIEAELKAAGTPVTVMGFEENALPLQGAYVRSGDRNIQILIAARQRHFFADFWERGVLLIKLRTASIARLADAISVWCAKPGTIRDMLAISPEVVASPVAEAYEAGPRATVERQWTMLLKRAAEGHSEMLPVINEAMTRPELRSLFPFMSLVHLCFSRCTGYPFSNDCPHVTPLSPNSYRVTGATDEILGDGGLEETIERVINNLPESCSAAIHGTAEDLPQKRKVFFPNQLWQYRVNDPVVIVFLSRSPEEYDLLHQNRRPPVVGDHGSILEITDRLTEPRYIVSCTEPDSTMNWVAKFTPEEIRPLLTPSGAVALEFARLLTVGDFETAHAMLVPSLRERHTKSQLGLEYADLIENSGASANDVHLLSDSENWMGKEPLDIGNAFISIEGQCGDQEGVWHEHIAVIVTDLNGKYLIRDIEWGGI